MKLPENQINMQRKKIVAPAVEGFAEKEKFAKGDIDVINWAEYRHKPLTKFAIAHTDVALLVRFDVDEPYVVGRCTQMHGEVYADSCVEFFVREPLSDHYFNFEINCIGTILAARRLSRTEKEYLSAEQMQRVEVRSSLPAAAPYEGEGAWSIELTIPFDVLGIESEPEVLEGNFYKCGDRTPVPHFVSWSPIDTPAPDFHRPEFFGLIELEK